MQTAVIYGSPACQILLHINGHAVTQETQSTCADIAYGRHDREHGCAVEHTSCAAYYLQPSSSCCDSFDKTQTFCNMLKTVATQGGLK